MKAFIASVALVASLVSANAQAPSPQTPATNITGTNQFCLKMSSGNSANCTYQTMAACETAKPANSRDECVDRSRLSGTTGSGAAPMAPPASNPPASNPPR
jgi:hypothetical protein